MRLREDTWHFKIYKIWRILVHIDDVSWRSVVSQFKHHWKDSEGELPYTYSQPRNLCQYLRVIFLWAPLRLFIFNYISLVIWLNVFAFNYLYKVLNAYSFEDVDFFYTISICFFVLVGIFTFIGICIGIGKIFEDKINPKFREKYRKAKDDFTASNIHRAYKDKFCPYIAFESKEEAENKEEES